MDTCVYTVEKLLIFLLATAHLEKQSLAVNLSRFFCYRRPKLVASAAAGHKAQPGPGQSQNAVPSSPRHRIEQALHPTKSRLILHPHVGHGQDPHGGLPARSPPHGGHAPSPCLEQAAGDSCGVQSPKPGNSSGAARASVRSVFNCLWGCPLT